jgi:HAMP domain-containing protein
VILLDSDQILAAIGRSLSTHVLPALGDEYARVQVQAALTALEEVRHRLAHGDPYETVNARIRERLIGLAAEVRTGTPAAAQRIDAALDELDGGGDARERHRRLAEALTELLASSDPALHGLRAVLEEQSIEVASTDARWICGPAIESLQ